MTFPAPFPPEDPPDAPPGPPPPPPWWGRRCRRRHRRCSAGAGTGEDACEARPIDDAESVAVTSLRGVGRDDTPSVPYRGGSMRRRFGLDDEDADPTRRFDRWREPEGK